MCSCGQEPASKHDWGSFFMPITAGSLFTGIGGFDLGLAQAGISTSWMCEIDPACRSVLQRHFPGVPIYEDVKTIGRDNVTRVDVLTGGFPCQDLSVAGKREGLAGKRSGLWWEFARVIDELEPQWIIAENVPGLLSSNKGYDFALIIRWLAERGYGVAWRILDAQYFGLAQRRRRVFIVANLGDGRAAEVLFESEGMSGDTPPSRETGESVARTIASGSNAYRCNPTCETFAISGIADYKQSIGTLRASGGDLGGGSEMLTVQPVAYNIQHNDGGQHRRKDRPNGGMYVNETDTSLTVGTTDLTAVLGWHENKGGSFSTEGIAKALRSGASHSYQGVGVRRLTPTECERLQGFPDGFTAEQSDSARYRQLGNAVAVPVVAWLGKRLTQVIENKDASMQGESPCCN